MSKRRVPDVPPKKRNYCHPSWSLAERLAYYSKPEPLTGCYIWLGAVVNGYGCLRYRGGHQQAHRLAWALKHGPIPKGLILCHRCNVRRCVNPDHLVLGTRADNNADTKAARLRLADAREATARASPAFDPGAAAIRIFVGGVEMRGRVLIEAAVPQSESDHSNLRSTKR
jgi:hypothetical protein